MPRSIAMASLIDYAIFSSLSAFRPSLRYFAVGKTLLCRGNGALLYYADYLLLTLDYILLLMMPCRFLLHTLLPL